MDYNKKLTLEGLQHYHEKNKEFINSSISNHNSSTTTHTDIRNLISGLTTRLNALADSDDTTLDQLSEIVAYIKSNRTLIENITTNKINVADIIDNLTSTATNKPLSANQGKVLNDLITTLKNTVNTKVDKISGKGLSTNDLTDALKGNYDTAYTHSQSTHARTDATKVEKSSTNGNIKINGAETTVYTHPSGTNPHGTTKSDVGLGNVGNFKAVSTVANQGLTDTEKSNARANIGAGTSSFSGSYNDLSNKPTIPSVGNGTVTIKQAGISKGTFTMNQSGNTTIELTDTDTNTWRPLGTTADTACAGNDSRLSNARPASDVYAWAKASSKPSYSYSEISGTPSSLPANGGTSTYANNVWTQSHNGSWYINSNWNGTHFVTNTKTADGSTLPIWVNNSGYADSAGNADTLDGNHASAFAAASHSHSNYLTDITKKMVTDALGYTPPTTDTNTWRGITTSLASTSTDVSLAASAGKSLQDQITTLNSSLALGMNFIPKTTSNCTITTLNGFDMGAYRLNAALMAKMTDKPKTYVGGSVYLIRGFEPSNDENFTILIMPKDKKFYIDYRYGKNWNGWQEVSVSSTITTS